MKLTTSLLALASITIANSDSASVVLKPATRASGVACSFHFAGGAPYFQHDAVVGGGYILCDEPPMNAHVVLDLDYRRDW